MLADGSLESSIHLLLRLQCVPLGYRTSGIGQHVWPVAQPNARSTITDPAFSDGVIAAQFVVVVHGDQQLDFLYVETEECQKLMQFPPGDQ